MIHTGQPGVPEGWAYRVTYPAVDVVALPPHAYLNQLRARRAKVLLGDGRRPADVS